MKTLLLTLSLFFIGYQVNAQDHIFAADSVEWNYLYYGDFGGLNGSSQSYMHGDSTVNGKDYKMLWNNSKNLIKGYVRYEGEQIYYLPYSDTIEYLAYDFTLQLGDTFVAYSSQGFVKDELIVSALDYDTDSTVVGFFLFNEYSGYEAYWRKGVGGNIGLTGNPMDFFTTLSVSGAHVLYCVTADGINEYENDVFYYNQWQEPTGKINCNGYTSLVLVNTQNIIQSNITISPNPFTTWLSLESDQLDQIKEIRIYNNIGQLVAMPKVSSVLSLPDLMPGVYTLVFATGEGLSYARVVKGER